MKLIVVSFLLLFCFSAYAQQPKLRLVHYQGNQFYQVKTEGNTKLLIFLHGGLSNPAFEKGQELPGVDFLLENNLSFQRLCQQFGYDLLLPVTNGKMNWVSNYPYCFQMLKGIVDSTGNYEQYFISGFSDGGTGSYRIFYTYPDYFNGLIVFNGYPQLNNFNRRLDYGVGRQKKVIFCSTNSDNTIPYEFLLTEYAKQKRSNPDTYIYVAKGGHSFRDYSQEDLEEVFSMLRTKSDNKKTDPVHGYVRHDSLIRFYEFRQKVYRKYSYEPDFLEENRMQKAALKK